MKKVLSVVGTRPEVIKVAPVIKALEKFPHIESRVLSTAQHRQMLDQMLELFHISPDRDLNIMEKNQTLQELTARLPLPLDEILEAERPDFVLSQGDTTTAFMVALACFYRKIPLGHIEAGLRTSDIYNPFPEEMNRLLISRFSALHFAPTGTAKEALLREGIPNDSIVLTGNTVIDSLKYILAKDLPLDPRIDPSKKLILVTAHRRENFGPPLEQICEVLKRIAHENEDVQVFYPLHSNPNVKDVVTKKLSGSPRITLTEPLSYDAFVRAMQQATLILSDSGGVQEEAPTLKIPVLVLREKTERPEGVKLNLAALVGTDSGVIAAKTNLLLNDKKAYQAMVSDHSPYGDGRAGEKIAEAVSKFLEGQ